MESAISSHSVLYVYYCVSLNACNGQLIPLKRIHIDEDEDKQDSYSSDDEDDDDDNNDDDDTDNDHDEDTDSDTSSDTSSDLSNLNTSSKESVALYVCYPRASLPEFGLPRIPDAVPDSG